MEQQSLDGPNRIGFKNPDGTTTIHIYPGIVNARQRDGTWRRVPPSLVKRAASDPRTSSPSTGATPATTGSSANATTTWVYDSTTGNHYGSGYLYVGSTVTDHASSYLQFNLNNTTAGFANAYVTQASLFLDGEYAGSCSSGTPVQVHPVTQQWDPKTLATDPSIGPKVGSATVLSGVNCSSHPRAYSSIQVDPTLITNWVHGSSTKNYGLALTTSSQSTFEEFDANDDYLSVTYTSSGDGATYTENTFAAPWNNHTGWASVTVRNEGSTTWTTAAGYKLGYAIYSVTGTTRTQHSKSDYPAAVPGSVAPNGHMTVTAKLPALTPPASGSYWEVCWDMLDGSAYFSAGGVPPSCYQLPVVNNPPVVTAVSPNNNATIYTTTPTLNVTANDPDQYPGKPLTYNYRVYSTTSTTALVSVDGSTVPQYQIPSGKLVLGGTYYWTVQVSDTVDSSPFVTPIFFSVPSAPQPLITAHLGQPDTDGSIDGVSPTVGDYSTQQTDASVPGGSVGPPVAITRTYNSLDPRTGDAFGAGWSSALDMRATPDTDGTGNVVITLASGRQERFGLNADGTYSPPEGVKAWLTNYPVGSGNPTGYELTDANHSQYIFTVTASDPLSGNPFKGLSSVGGSGSAGFLSLDWEPTTLPGVSGTTLLPASMYGPGTSHPRLAFTWGDQQVATTTGATVTLPHVTTVSYTLNPGQTADANTPSDTWNYGYNATAQLTSVCPPTSPTQCTQYTYTASGNTGSHYASMVNDSDPTDYWRLNDAAGVSTTLDSVAVHEGTTNGVASNVTFGQPGHLAGTPSATASFNGTSSDIALPSGLIGSVNASVGLWFKTTQAGGTLFSYQSAAAGATQPSGYVPAIYIGTDGRLRSTFYMGAKTPITTTTAVNDGQWHQVVLSGAATTESLYVDGKLIGSASGTIDAATTWPYTTVGAGQLANWPAAPSANLNGWFSGQISDVWYGEHPTGLPAVDQEYAAAITPASELVSATLPSGKTAVQLSYDVQSDRATQVTTGDGGTYKISLPSTSGSTAYYRGTVDGTHPSEQYPLNEDGGSEAVDSLATPAQSGTADGYYNDVVLGSPGIFGPDGDTAASFNGTDSYVSLPEGAFSDSNAAGSIAMWFKTSTAGGTLFSYQDSPVGTTSTNHEPALYIGTDGKLYAGFAAYPEPTSLVSTRVVTDGLWHLVVLTQNDLKDQATLWIDGKIEAQTFSYSMGGQVGNQGLYYDSIGAGYTTSDNTKSSYATNPQGYFNGQIAEVGIYGQDFSQLIPDAGNYLYKARGSSASLTPTTNVTITDPSGATENYALDPGNGYRAVAYTDANGGVTSYSYDAHGFEQAVTDPDGHSTSVQRDSIGDIDALTRCQYSGTCQTSTATYDTSSAQTDYSAGNELTSTDPRYHLASGNTSSTNYTTTYTYNSDGLLATKTSPPTAEASSGQKTSYTYTTASTPSADGGTDVGYQLATVTDPRGEVTKYTYYSGGQLATETSPSGAVTKYGYTKDSYATPSVTQTSDTYPNGVSTTYGYDSQNRLITETDPATTDAVTGVTHTRNTTVTYDVDGNITAITTKDLTGGDPSRTWTWTYTSGNRVASATDPNGNKTTYAYDSVGNKTSETRPDGTTITYAYSPTSQLITTTLKGWTGSGAQAAPTDLVLESRAYDPAGRLASVTDSMGRTTNYYYTNDNKTALVVSGTTAAGSTTTAITEYYYDSAGNLIYSGSDCAGQFAEDCDEATSYTYDPVDRLSVMTQSSNSTDQITTTYAYDADNDTTSRTIAGAGSPGATTYTYDALGDPATQTVHDGSTLLTTSKTYDERGLLIATTDPNGNTTHYVNDQLGQRTTTTQPTINVETVGGTAQPASPTILSGYDTYGEIADSSDPDGNVTTNTYDGDGNLTAVVGAPYTPPGSAAALTPTTTYTYDALSQQLSVKNPDGQTTTTAYDQLGNPITVTRPDGTQSHESYDTDDELLTLVSPGGAQTQYTYDTLGQRVTSTQLERSPTSAAYTTSYTWSPTGELLTTTDPAGDTTARTYDSNRNLATVTDPLGNLTTYTYNALAEPTSTTNADGTKTVQAYDAAGRLTSTTQLNAAGASQAVTGYGYDADGHQTSLTNPLNVVTTSHYDAVGNLTGQSQPTSSNHSITTSFGYDAAGNRTRYTDPNGNATTYTYNALGLPESTILPVIAGDTALADRATLLTYDAAGHPIAETQPGNVSTGATYNSLGQLTSTSGSGAAATPTRTYTYTPDGQLATANASGITDTFTYNDRGQLLSSASPNDSTTYTYDADDRLTARTDPAGSATFGYNADSQLTTQTGPMAGLTASFTYTSTGQPSTITYAGGATRTYTHNALHQLTDDKITSAGGNVLTDTSYTHNTADQTTGTTTATCATGCSTARTYAYDQAGRLTGATTAGTTATYGYDDSGNVTTAGATSNTYNARDELTTSTTGTNSTAYSYTLRGTLASVSGGTGQGNYSANAYNETTAAATSSYTYDPIGRLDMASTASGTYTFGYDGLATSPTTDGHQTYGYTATGNLFSVQAGSTPALAITNQHDDLTATLTSSGLTGTTTYTPTGGVAASTGTSTDLGYQSGWTDPTTGQVDASARWYSPATDSFTTPDSVQNTPTPAVNANPYAYANDDPLDLNDLSGNDACRDYESNQEEEYDEEVELEREQIETEVEDAEYAAEAAASDAEEAAEEAATEAEDARDARVDAEEEAADDEYADEVDGDFGGLDESAAGGAGDESDSLLLRGARALYNFARNKISKGVEGLEGDDGAAGVAEGGVDLLEGLAAGLGEFASVGVHDDVTGPDFNGCDQSEAPERPNEEPSTKLEQERVSRAIDDPNPSAPEDPGAIKEANPDPYQAPDETQLTSTDSTTETAADDIPIDDSGGMQAEQQSPNGSEGNGAQASSRSQGVDSDSCQSQGLTQALQSAANRLRDSFVANPAEARSVLSLGQLNAVIRAPGLTRVFFGIAMEQGLAADPGLASQFARLSGPNAPDFIGADSQGYEVTTTNPGTIEEHLARPYVDADRLVTYEPPPDEFTFAADGEC